MVGFRQGRLVAENVKKSLTKRSTGMRKRQSPCNQERNFFDTGTDGVYHMKRFRSNIGFHAWWAIIRFNTKEGYDRKEEAVNGV